ncbi:extracellular solute-binding protein [Clostridium sp. CF012]|uniref:extracellular solute-binding protein n=1 Tax=Clostridium sp. CF012 TaxID=2843319 RepID=UPI001C0B4407|nr:extracellular solute-binding protein [Clostridium sp. CF012]MBU3144357.1 extracellular solute-binding protein [Clostridium sp. CF012]
MKKIKSRFLLCIGLLIIIFSSGCSTKDKEKPPNVKNTSLEEKNEKSSYKLPLTEKPTTLTWASNDNYYAPSSLNKQLEVWKEIEKKTNVEIQWEALPNSQYIAEMQLKLSNEESLPDLLVVPNSDPTQYGQTGLFIPLETLIEKYAPNIEKAFKVYPGSKELMTSADGHIYGLASIIEGSSDTLPNTFTIRKDWLQQLGLKEPNTLEEWHTVLKAFKEKDPNGNGKKDEIPFGSSPYYFGEAFGLELMSGSDFKVENDKVIYQWADERMRGYLSFVQGLYKEGLIDQDFGMEAIESTQMKVVKDKVGAYVNYPDWINSWQKLLHSRGKIQAKYIPILPPLGEKKERSLDSYFVIDKRFSSISKNCKNPVLAIKLLDYLWSEEGIRYMAWGIEGKTYVIKQGKESFTDFVIQNKEGLGLSDALRTVGAWPTVPWIQQREQYLQILSLDPNFKNLPELIKPVLKKPFPMLLANKEEQERLTILENNISTYRDEMMIRFIIGDDPLKNFDKYIRELKSLGLEELIQIKQKQYNRFMKH